MLHKRKRRTVKTWTGCVCPFIFDMTKPNAGQAIAWVIGYNPTKMEFCTIISFSVHPGKSCKTEAFGHNVEERFKDDPLQQKDQLWRNIFKLQSLISNES